MKYKFYLLISSSTNLQNLSTLGSSIKVEKIGELASLITVGSDDISYILSDASSLTWEAAFDNKKEADAAFATLNNKED